MTVPLLRVDNLHARPVESDTGPILRGLDLTVDAGEVHAILSPAGSERSTLGAALMGSSEVEVTAGAVEFNGDDITEWPTDERAKAGMFLAFQDPQKIPGVSVIQFLHHALSVRKGIDRSAREVRQATIDWAHRLGMDSSLVDRHLDEGFSSGEKQLNEMLQIAILEPKIALLDETTSGLDIDVLRIVAKGIREVRTERSEMGVVLITDDPGLLDEVTADHVHVFVDGRIVANGGRELAAQLEQHGSEAFKATV